METFEDLRKCWQENTSRNDSADTLSKESVEKVIRSRIRREKNTVMQYFWASFAYQVLIYAFASHLIIKFWGDGELMLLAFCGTMLYIPFTILLMKKFKAMSIRATDNLDFSGQDIRSSVKNQYVLLADFFRFKKMFEWLAIPLSCLIMVLIVFKLYVPGEIEEHVTGAIISFLALLSCFAAAIYFQNRKRFIAPLRQLKLILEDIAQDSYDLFQE
ncbi:MAG: hypothetical protein ABIO46_10895 [Chitinophagales bacterium]